MGFAINIDIDYALDHRDVQTILAECKRQLKARKQEMNSVPLDQVVEFNTLTGSATISVQRFPKFKKK